MHVRPGVTGGRRRHRSRPCRRAHKQHVQHSNRHQRTDPDRGSHCETILKTKAEAVGCYAKYQKARHGYALRQIAASIDLAKE